MFELYRRSVSASMLNLIKQAESEELGGISAS